MKNSRSNPKQAVTEPDETSECGRALQKLTQLIFDGLQHGFFDCTVNIETIDKKKRCLLIKAGRSYKFIIPQEELEASS